MGKDLASLLVQQPTPGMRYAQGRILEWNPETFENRIQYGNTAAVHTNLPVVGTTDALSYQPGQLVALYGMDATGAGGGQQWWIAGRLFTPGGANAEALVDFMRGQIARSIAVEVFADRIHTAYDAAIAQRNSEAWGDPTNGATAGPGVTGVDIVTGSALIIISAGIEFSTSNNAANATPRVGGVMSAQISGATTVAPDEETGMSAQSIKSRSGGAIALVDGIINVTTVTAVYLQTGLNPGLHDFALKYRKWSSASDYLNVDQRSLTVVAF
jgi:hypothetical protein